MHILGIDIGGTGIKGAPVDTETGTLLAERLRLLTPDGAKPRPVAKVVAEIAVAFDWHGPIGCGFPAVIQNGLVRTAANIHPKWIDSSAEMLFAEETGCPVRVVNDADAAGMAEMTFGAGRGRMGTVLIVTIGTGLGTAIFTQGHLVPNVEMGHIELDGEDAERTASDAARKRDHLSWQAWGAQFNRYLQRMESLLWPDLIILGGGVAKSADKFWPYLDLKAEVVLAQFLNEAGIVGAALAAQGLAPRTDADHEQTKMQ
jgi:polyphosphate glucokinase